MVPGPNQLFNGEYHSFLAMSIQTFVKPRRHISATTLCFFELIATVLSSREHRDRRCHEMGPTLARRTAIPRAQQQC